MKTIAWHRFRASAAERITGMPLDQQRIRRAKRQLTSLSGSGKAALSAPLLAEMLFVQSVSPLGLVRHTMSVRSAVAKWVSFWAATAPNAIQGIEQGEQIKWARKLAGVNGREKIPTHLLLHHDFESWRDVVLTDDPSTLEWGENGVAVIVDLKWLGLRLAARAETPLAEVGKSDTDHGYLKEED
jgi:hypothetical protein